MRNERTQELADRLNTGWQQWKTVELADEKADPMADFFGDMEATTNGRMIEFDAHEINPYFMLAGEGEIYHFYYITANDTWYCKA